MRIGSLSARPTHTISGAPSTHVPCSPNVAALHFRLDENGVDAVRVQPGGVGNASHKAWIVWLRVSSAASAAERVGHQILADVGIVGDGLERVESHHAFGDRSRLVEEHDVDARETFDRGQLLHEHAATRERDRRDRERQAREEHQPFGDHRDDARDHSGDRPVPRVVLHGELADREQRRSRDQCPLDQRRM